MLIVLVVKPYFGVSLAIVTQNRTAQELDSAAGHKYSSVGVALAL